MSAGHWGLDRSWSGQVLAVMIKMPSFKDQEPAGEFEIFARLVEALALHEPVALRAGHHCMSVPLSPMVGSHAEGVSVMLPERHGTAFQPGRLRRSQAAMRSCDSTYATPLKLDRGRKATRQILSSRFGERQVLLAMSMSVWVAMAQAQKEPCATPGENSAFLASRPFGCGRARRPRPRARHAKTPRR